jgi:hypothetical protein
LGRFVKIDDSNCFHDETSSLAAAVDIGSCIYLHSK